MPVERSASPQSGDESYSVFGGVVREELLCFSRAFSLFAKSRECWLLFVLIGFFCVLLFLGPSGFGGVPYRTEVQNALAVIYGLFPAVFLARHFASAQEQIERSVGGLRLPIIRASWYLAVTLLVLLAVVAKYAIDPYDAATDSGLRREFYLMMIRNVLFVVAVAQVGARILDRNYSWAPGAFLVMVSWALGTTNHLAEPAWWALPLFRSSDTLAAVLAILLWVGAGIVYIGGRRSGR